MRQLLAIAVTIWLAATSPVLAEVRVALVVGNSAYVHAPALANPRNDARAMAAALRAQGFDVLEVADAAKAAMEDAIRRFGRKLAKADVALLYYAGHGLQVGLQNYLMPVDARLESERDLPFEAVKLEFVMRQMEVEREGRTTIVILDACRDNPMARSLARSMGTRSLSVGRGLASAPAGLGTFIAYATQPGNVARDGSGQHSPFTAALLRHIAVPGRNLPAVFIEVRKDVVAATSGQQVPWDHSALTADFYFVPPGRPAAIRPVPEKARDAAVAPPARPAAGHGSIPPIQREADRARAPTTTLEDNVRLEGRVVASSRQPNPQACQALCEADPACVGYQHGRKIPVMSRCDIFDRVDARFEDRAWRSGVRTR